MSGYFILAILALAFVVTFQIAKASEYVSVLKGEEKSFKQTNRINAFMFIQGLETLPLRARAQSASAMEVANARDLRKISSLMLFSKCSCDGVSLRQDCDSN